MKMRVVIMIMWIRRMQDCEKVKDQDVDEAHRKYQEVHFKSRVLHIKKNGL